MTTTPTPAPPPAPKPTPPPPPTPAPPLPDWPQDKPKPGATDVASYARRLTASEYRMFDTAVKQEEAYLSARGEDLTPAAIDQIYEAVLGVSAQRSAQEFREAYNTYVLGYLNAQVRATANQPSAYADWTMALAQARAFLPEYMESYEDAYLRRRQEWTGGNVPYMGLEEFNAQAAQTYLQESLGRLSERLSEDSPGGSLRIAQTAAILGDGLQELILAKAGVVLQAEQNDLRKAQLETALNDIVGSLEEQVFETEEQRKRAERIISELKSARGRLAADYVESGFAGTPGEFLEQAILPVLQRRFVADPQATAIFTAATGGTAAIGAYIAAPADTARQRDQFLARAAEQLRDEAPEVRAQFTPEALEQLILDAERMGRKPDALLTDRIARERITQAPTIRQREITEGIQAGRIGPGGQIPIEEFQKKAVALLEGVDPEVRALFEGTVSETDFQTKLSAIYQRAIRLGVKVEDLFEQELNRAVTERKQEVQTAQRFTGFFRQGRDIGQEGRYRTYPGMSDAERDVFIRDWLPVALARAKKNKTDVDQEVENMRRIFNTTLTLPGSAQEIMTTEGIVPRDVPPPFLPRTTSPQTIEQATAEGNEALADRLLREQEAQRRLTPPPPVLPSAPAPTPTPTLTPELAAQQQAIADAASRAAEEQAKAALAEEERKRRTLEVPAT